MGIQTGGNLVVPLVLWGRQHPSHTISAIGLSYDQKTLLTGSAEGQLCLWEFSLDYQTMVPKFMMYGHTGSVTCITAASYEKPLFVSSSSSGEMCLWDLSDGRCVETYKSSHIHRSMQTYKLDGGKSLSLICNGNYPEILIMNSETLEIVYSLVARVHPDWINALCAIRPIKRSDDVILAITRSGTIKMWSIDIHMVKSMHVYEDESKQIRCTDAQMLRCCPYNQRTVLVVCSKYWQIYDAGEFSLLCNEPCCKDSHWTGGEFIAIDKVIIWDNTGQAFLYKLPTNKVPSKPARPPGPVAKQTSKRGANSNHQDYHHLVGKKAMQSATASLYCIINTKESKILESPSQFICLKTLNSDNYLAVRADANGSVYWWRLNSQPPRWKDDHIPTMLSDNHVSLSKLWESTSPISLLDHLKSYTGEDVVVTSSLYIESLGRLICGLENGDIFIIPVINTVRSLLLKSSKDSKGRYPLYRKLVGHKARVNCLLYPYGLESRYNPNYLLSGSSDFTINLWDLSLGQLAHSFCVHAGEITHLYIPPPNCNTRILSCVCSVASDHSVALLSLKERRCLVFASRHMFPVYSIKWRPLEDYIIISCTDSTAYVWQMETGLLDRVVHGVTAVEMLKACDEAAHKILIADNPTNPQISLAQAFKRRNLATFRNLAQQAIQQIGDNLVDDGLNGDAQGSAVSSLRSQPFTVQGLGLGVGKPEAHILLFDTESLIINLLCDEFGLPSDSVNSQSSSKKRSDLEQGITDFFSMVKKKAEDITQIAVQSKAESMGMKMDGATSGQGSINPSPSTPRRRGSDDSAGSKDSDRTENWGLDNDLDKLCSKKLGLERLNQPVSFGLLSSTGQMVLMLPSVNTKASPLNDGRPQKEFWEVSSALTTQHLLSVISLANTLMSMGNPTFIRQRSSRRRYQSSELQNGDAITNSSDDHGGQSEIKHGWSLLNTLHCVLLPDLVKDLNYRSPQLHLLANRWQDRCLEVREASQALLLAELKRIGPEGRHKVIVQWAPYMPNLVDDNDGTISMVNQDDEVPLNRDDDNFHSLNMSHEKKRLEATAIVMLGVIGAEFGKEIQPKSSRHRRPSNDFGLGKHSYAMHTSKALAYLLLSPQKCKLSLYAPIRRAAIDIIGRGFPVWQPYVDVSAVILGLLDICIDADKIIPSVQSGLPLTPVADACRTARHALTLIATSQPATFLTCMAKEVARYNAAAQNPQSGTPLNANVLIRAKPEILRVIELLIEKLPNDVADLLIETMDVAVHCLDPNSIKSRGLQETFPALCRFSMVSYCTSSRRICVGSKNGSMAFYELKQSKAQSIPFQASPTSAMILYLKASSKETITAHQGAVAAVAFSDDGKYVASYSPVDAKVKFWQSASSSLFGIGNPHTKCIKVYTVPWKNPGPPQPNVTRGGRLIWSDPRSVTLVLPDGSESGYRI